jgi:uncharacterized protein (DUF1499 family)
MNTPDPAQNSKWPRWIGAAAGVVLAVTLLALLLAGPGYQAGLLELRPAFSVLRVAAGGAVLCVVVGLAAAVMNWRRGTQGMLAVGIVAALVGLALTLNNVGWYQKARSVPLIHDITTDLDNPPVFVDVLPLRADAPNPPDYAGEEIAEQQRGAYADIVPITVDVDPDAAFAAAESAARSMGWEMVGSDAAAGRIECTDTTAYFGFKDDVVIRIREEGAGTRLDIRSKSRVGLSDVGTNAQRIRDFREAFLARL